MPKSKYKSACASLRKGHLNKLLDKITDSNPMEAKQDDESRLVTVCSACFRASCWHGEFYCSEYRIAGTVEKTVRELKKLNLEHSCYWDPNR